MFWKVSRGSTHRQGTITEPVHIGTSTNCFQLVTRINTQWRFTGMNNFFERIRYQIDITIKREGVCHWKHEQIIYIGLASYY